MRTMATESIPGKAPLRMRSIILVIPATSKPSSARFPTCQPSPMSAGIEYENLGGGVDCADPPDDPPPQPATNTAIAAISKPTRSVSVVGVEPA